MTDPSTFDYERLQLPSSSTLFEYGDSSDAFYLLSNGSIDLRHEGTTIFTIDERDHPLGTAGVVLNAPRQYTSVVNSESTLKKYPLDREGFFEWLNQRPLLLTDILQNYASIVDYFNESNQEYFEFFRQHRSVVQQLIQPLSQISSGVKILANDPAAETPEKLAELVSNSPFEPLIENYRQIVNITGRSNESDLADLNVPEETIESVDPGEIICSEGDVGDNLYVLIHGSLSVFKGGQRLAVIDQPGSVFGEMSPVLMNERRATVKADTSAEVSVISYDRLQTLLDESPEFSRKLIMIFFKRYQRALQLNYSLKDFLGYLKNLVGGNGLPSDARNYLDRLGEELRGQNFCNKDLNAAREDFLRWLNQDEKFSDEEVPPESLSQFTSKDMSY